jgi:three-Cys-motif partner protein
LGGTSIAISLDKLKKVQDALATSPRNIHDTTYRAIYVEENRNRYIKLKKYLENNCPPGIECYPSQGDYSSLHETILQQCGEGFAFFFVDPKGWLDIGIPKLAGLLSRINSEFLITFMYDFLIRAVRIEELHDQVSQLLGDVENEWIKELWRLEQSKREEKVVRRYREQLKTAMGGDGPNKPRSYYATILDKSKNRTKYHMVYLTRHPKGIVEFAKLSEKTEILQRRVRMQREEDRSGQCSLFPPKDSDLRDQFSANIEDVKRFWLDHLNEEESVYNEADLADWLEESDWLESDLQAAFKELVKEGKVENIDMQRNRRTRFVHFGEGEHLRRCI